jgi:hypothetical protein
MISRGGRAKTLAPIPLNGWLEADDGDWRASKSRDARQVPEMPEEASDASDASNAPGLAVTGASFGVPLARDPIGGQCSLARCRVQTPPNPASTLYSAVPYLHLLVHHRGDQGGPHMSYW